MTEVYAPTTAPNPKSSFFMVPYEHLDKVRFIIKVLEVLLSLVAFVLEEVVNSCIKCGALYFFEFVSCTAFLFTLLLLILLSTNLHQKVNISCWPKLDLIYTGIIALLFFIASIVFAAENSNKTLEKVAVAFGFMATLAFAADVALFVKTSGFLFLRGRKSEASGASPSVEAPAETEKLNTQANGGE